MNLSLSPSIRPTPGGNIDPTRQADFPILLNESFAENARTKDSRFFGVRYNYRPKQTPKQRSKISRVSQSSSIYKLALEDSSTDSQNPITYTYSGSIDPDIAKSSNGISSLALVYDHSKNAFIAQPLSTELNFNITSGPGQKSRSSQPRLKTFEDNGSGDGSDEEDLFGTKAYDSDDETPPKDNPFDYRHFLQQAKQDASSGIAAASSMTPLTDMNGSSSPALGSKPGPTSSSLLPAPKDGSSSSKAATTTPKSLNRGPAKSKSSTTVPAKPVRSVPQPSTSRQNTKLTTTSTTNKSKPTPRAPSPHSSPSLSQSPSPPAQPSPNPNIVIDAASDLIIDMGSPPSRPLRSLHKIDPSAFASASQSEVEPDTVGLDSEEEEEQEQEEEDAHMQDVGRDSDVDSLTLGSPKQKGLGISTGGGMDIDRDEEEIVDGDDGGREAEVDMDDEDEELRKQMEAALEAEDEDENEGMGQQVGVYEEESEVSEEE
ncbi:MAG: hypothetical protein Q9227_006905 [Pyrenula ochraceoflavens]